MIFKEALSPERQASSQHNYCMFNVINGLSYMCLGETVLILLAVQLGCPDYFISTLGAMLYFGFLLLPLGKIMTARVGAARAQAYFWIARNGAALMVASASVFGYFGMMKTAMALLLIGSFFFYGFRAAGVVMSQPLIGDFTDDRNRARVIAVSVGLFYVSCLIALLTISFVLHLSPSLWTLTGIVVVGACLGFTSSRFLARIDETENIRRSARRPILPELKNILGAVTIRRQIMAGFMVNLGVIMLVPVSMLALKRGYGVSDTDALMFALVQFTACAVMSFLSGKVAAVIGPRKTILFGYILLLSIGVLWLVAPASLNGFYMALPFFFAGGTMVSMNNSVTHYFLQTVPPENRVAASMFVSVVTGACSGVVGMILAGFLLKLCITDPGDLLAGYRVYFLVAALLLSPGIWLISRLTPLSSEKRKLPKSWQDVR